MKVVSKKASDRKRKLFKIRKVFEEASTEVEHLRSTIWSKTKVHTEERNRLIEECKRLSGVIERMTWDAATNVLQYSHLLQWARERISVLESLKVTEEDKWEAAVLVV